MLATKTYTFTRDEIVELVRFKSLEQGRESEDVFRNFAVRDLRDFSRLPEAYTLCAGAGACVREAVGNGALKVKAKKAVMTRATRAPLASVIRCRRRET